MAIVNGTFDTDLNGWAEYTDGNADISWESGRAKLRTYRCEIASISQDFLIDKTGLSIDWEYYREMCPERPGFRVVVDGQEVYYFDTPGNWPPYCEYNITYTGTHLIDLSLYVGNMATLEIFIHGYPGYCSFGDHANAYFWVDNVKTVDLPIGSINFTSDPSGAKIFIDEIDQGITTPATITRLSIGVHTYRLSSPGFYDIIGETNVVSGTINVSIDFMSKMLGCHTFNALPHGANVYVDGHDMRVATPAKVCGIPLGYHTYVITGTFVVEKDKGCEFFLTVPKDARIIIDEVDQGEVTPAKVCGILPGIHTYALQGTVLI